ncbi:hypothetical protein H8R18_00615 [Nanchangia anserum]|uniref:Uncharacterized protein n=1 Tax=Nanchangia anserum TaxID=2692125 RepID=A0A8I0GDX0_9ACTO|nr:hypothetical protein [Nanchangia anserum]MBD3689748.1 hypothetical protein [Nanchangia anserum]QOX81917.1 hypothetical protein H8R18_00615 [Nanchangia anserum]
MTSTRRGHNPVAITVLRAYYAWRVAKRVPGLRATLAFIPAITLAALAAWAAFAGSDSLTLQTLTTVLAGLGSVAAQACVVWAGIDVAAYICHTPRAHTPTQS